MDWHWLLILGALLAPVSCEDEAPNKKRDSDFFTNNMVAFIVVGVVLILIIIVLVIAIIIAKVRKNRAAAKAATQRAHKPAVVLSKREVHPPARESTAFNELQRETELASSAAPASQAPPPPAPPNTPAKKINSQKSSSVQTESASYKWKPLPPCSNYVEFTRCGLGISIAPPGFPLYDPIGVFTDYEPEVAAFSEQGLNYKLYKIDQIIKAIDANLFTAGLSVNEAQLKITVPDVVKSIANDRRNAELYRMRLFYYQNLKEFITMRNLTDVTLFKTLSMWNVYLHLIRSDLHPLLRRQLAVLVMRQASRWFERVPIEVFNDTPHPLPMMLKLKRTIPQFFEDEFIANAELCNDTVDELDNKSPITEEVFAAFVATLEKPEDVAGVVPEAAAAAPATAGEENKEAHPPDATTDAAPTPTTTETKPLTEGKTTEAKQPVEVTK